MALLRDKDARWIFLSGSLLTRKNSYLESFKDGKSDTYCVRVFMVFVKSKHKGLQVIQKNRIFSTLK